MKIQLTKLELANLFSQTLNINIVEDNVYIKEDDAIGEPVIILDGIPVDTLIKLHNEMTRKTETNYDVYDTSNSLDSDKKEDNNEQVDVLTMEDLHTQNIALTNKSKSNKPELEVRPLGPNESFDPPGEVTEAELNALKG